MSKMPDKVYLSAEAVMDLAVNDSTEAYKERDDYFPTEYIRADLVPKWISVGEGMPNEGEIIELAVIGQHSKEVIQGIYEFRTWYGADNQPLGDDFTVTHWRERPEYPGSD